MDAKTQNLRKALDAMSPEHDTAIGLVHPYWARKPLNIVETVIGSLSAEGGLVVDPFMGSGTTLYAALKNNRTAVGGDINPLSVFIVRAILEIAKNSGELIPEIEKILNEHHRLTSPWFMFNEHEYMERERYDVDGTFVGGKFKLIPTEVITKQNIGGLWRKRRAYNLKDGTIALPKVSKEINKYLTSPIDFDNMPLIPNSRIAIPEGAKLSHYFTPENQASINVLISLIKKSPLYKNYPDALMLILSSALPLMRLSDKKASSQWPYWRPKQNLTSRNPIIVLADRFKAIKKLADWTDLNLAYINQERLLSGNKQDLNVYNISAQRLESEMKDIQADLVFTDPPYGDQVPYIEYSSLWTGILGLAVDEKIYREEMVKSDAEARRDDTKDYYQRLEDTFMANARILKDGGYMVWYYQDQDLSCWQTIHASTSKAGLRIVDVIPLPKQRRSLKTVTSPNSTLDGDLLCIFKKENKTLDSTKTHSSIEDLRNKLKQNDQSYFEKYAVLISHTLKYDLIDTIATQYKTVKRALDALTS